MLQLLLAGAVGHHLGEAGHVGGQGVQVGAARADAGELGPLFGVEAVGAGEQPAGDLAGFGHGRDPGG